MYEKLAYMLRKIGVPPHLVGYDYIIEAIAICSEDRKAIHSITKCVYPIIARKYASNASRVERGIRHAITFAFDNGDLNVLYSVFGNTVSFSKGRVTNQHFIAAVIEILVHEPNHPIFKGSQYEVHKEVS